MTRKTRLTPWFPADVKPVHVGVYMTRTHEGERTPWFNKWDGHRWMVSMYSASQAEKCKALSSYTEFEWRGLAEKPG